MSQDVPSLAHHPIKSACAGDDSEHSARRQAARGLLRPLERGANSHWALEKGTGALLRFREAL